MAANQKSGVLLMDANVIIDYLRSGVAEKIFPKVRKSMGQVCLVEAVFHEIYQLTEDDLEKLSIKIVKSTSEQIKRADKKLGQLSYSDRLCLWMAVEFDYVCVSNDKDLLKACKERGVEVIRGLRLIKELVRTRDLSTVEAISVIKKIRDSDKIYYHEKLIAKVINEIRKLDAKNM